MGIHLTQASLYYHGIKNNSSSVASLQQTHGSRANRWVIVIPPMLRLQCSKQRLHIIIRDLVRRTLRLEFHGILVLPGRWRGP